MRAKEALKKNHWREKDEKREYPARIESKNVSE
jgi:hypothetical protein